MDYIQVWMADCKYCGASYQQTVDYYSTAYCSMECTRQAILTANPDLVSPLGPHRHYGPYKPVEEQPDDEPRGCYCGRTKGSKQICKNPICKKVRDLVETGWKSEPPLVRINRDGVMKGTVDLTEEELDELVPIVTHFFINQYALSSETVWETQRISTLDTVEGASPEIRISPSGLGRKP